MLARQSRILDQADRASNVPANESPISENFEGFTDEDLPGSPAMDEDYIDEPNNIDAPSASMFAPIDDIPHPRPDPLPPATPPSTPPPTPSPPQNRRCTRSRTKASHELGKLYKYTKCLYI